MTRICIWRTSSPAILVDRLRKALKGREVGTPSRFLYDNRTPFHVVALLKATFGLSDDDLIPGGRYHNLHELHGFPDFGLPGLRRIPLPRLRHPALSGDGSLFDVVRSKDQVLHTPYQDFEPVLRFVEEAAQDDAVDEISMALYRVARDSRVGAALIRAAERGAKVTAFVEVKARFDEAQNLEWAARMEAAGVHILYSMPGIKVHAKILYVSRHEDDGTRAYAFVGTGNFNERTSAIYADHGLFTADQEIAAEVGAVFAHLRGEQADPVFEHLLVAPFNLRSGFEDLIAGEEEIAKSGGDGRMILKMNSLEDPEMIGLLYGANEAGVNIRLIVRGICCLRPGIERASDRVWATSIVGRFLEHARIYLFRSGGEDRMYIASADWMERNLNRRIEVAAPIRDPDVRAELRHVLALQLADTRHARVLDEQQRNEYVSVVSGPKTDAQAATYEYLTKLLTPGREAGGRPERGPT